jgi:hypothetical protein
MLRASPGLRVLAALGWLGTAGCTTLRELPPASYATAAERKHVEVDTRDGQHHEFEFARFGSDTLVGFVPDSSEGRFEEFTEVTIPFEAVAKLSVRRVEWYRTGLIGGATLTAVVLAALGRHKSPAPTPEPPPCPTEPCP